MKVNLILAAGQGKRFSEAGYKLPKPLIPVNGLPMVIAASRYLPKADKFVFVVSKSQVKDYRLDHVLKKHYREAIIVVQTGELRGQAHSCLVAKDHIHPEDVLTVATCDSGVVYDQAKFNKLMADPKNDALIWSFRNYPPMAANPTAYGWIDIGPRDYVRKVSYKMPLSPEPLRDHAVVGHFTYKKAKYCFDNIEQMIKENRKTGLEFSLDECSNVLVGNGLKVKVFEVDKFLCWGTPNELKTYEYWNRYFKLKNNKVR